MKIKNTQNKNKKYIITTSVVIALVLGACGWAIWLNSQPKEEFKSESSTSKEEPETSKKQEEKIEAPKLEDTSSATGKKDELKTDKTNSDAPQQSVVSGGVTNFVVTPSVHIENGQVRLSARIDALYSEEGTCQFTLIHSSGLQKIFDTTILPSPQHKYCAAKEIAISELDKSGEWKLYVKYENTKFNYKGASNEKKFTVEL